MKHPFLSSQPSSNLYAQGWLPVGQSDGEAGWDARGMQVGGPYTEVQGLVSTTAI